MEDYSGTIIRDGPRFVGLKLYTPLPPTLNQTYKPFRVGEQCRIRLGTEARNWKLATQTYVRCLLNEQGVCPSVRDLYSVTAVQYLRKDTRDVDANIKLAMDAVFGGFGFHDRRVRRVVLEKRVDRTVPSYLSILVTVMEDG